MNLDKTSNALKRINRLFELISEMGEASQTEQDLLKAYVKDLYTVVSDGEQLAAQQASKPVPAVAPPPPPAPEPVEQIEAEAEAPKVKKDTQARPAPSSKKANDPELSELFETESINELSDKLSFSPISDLTKAMGLNEKIFTVNELFGGNNAEFQNTMVALNGLGSYDEAKSVLMGSVANKYGWGEPGKLKKARNFIKLVQRRYK